MMSCIATIGKCGITTRPSFTNQQINSVICGKGVNPKFLYYTFTQLKSALEAVGGGGSVYTNVSKSRFSNIEVQIPPLKEQQAIACILGALDDKIELNRRMNETLEAMARAIFKSWFVDFDPVRAKAEGQQPPGLAPHIADLFPDGFEESELGEIPKGWSLLPLGEVCEFCYGKGLKASDRNPGAVAVMGSNGQVGWHDTALVKGPGIIVGRKGNPGVVTWVHRDFYPIDTTFYVVPKIPFVPLTYLNEAIRRLDLARFGADSAVPGLNRNIAYMSRIIVPPPGVLTVFNRQILIIKDRIHHSEEQNQTLATLRDTLLPRLISGELRVPDAERIVGRVL